MYVCKLLIAHKFLKIINNIFVWFVKNYANIVEVTDKDIFGAIRPKVEVGKFDLTSTTSCNVDWEEVKNIYFSLKTLHCNLPLLSAPSLNCTRSQKQPHWHIYLRVNSY